MAQLPAQLPFQLNGNPGVVVGQRIEIIVAQDDRTTIVPTENRTSVVEADD